MNPSSIRRFVFTLITGYLAIFGIQSLPYEIENQWAILIPVLIVVYMITVWLDGVLFNDNSDQKDTKKPSSTAPNGKPSSRGFGT